MRDHHTSQHSHANLVDSDTRDCHLEQPPEEICPKKNETFKDLPNVFGITDNIWLWDMIEMVKIMIRHCREYYKYADKWTSN